MPLHRVIEDVVHAYLEGVDVAAPDLFEASTLTGAAALGDFRPHRSDIDFVAVTSAPPDDLQLAALERVHAQLRRDRRRPSFDGIYVTWEDLARDPAQIERRSSSHEGRLRSAPTGGASPITWRTVAPYSRISRGPDPAIIEFWSDPEGLAARSQASLKGYWNRFRDRSAQLFSTGPELPSSWAADWAGLGVSRIHCTPPNRRPHLQGGCRPLRPGGVSGVVAAPG